MSKILDCKISFLLNSKSTFRDKKVDWELIAVLEWFARPNGITPGQSCYPVEYLKKRKDTARLLIGYYESKLILNTMFDNDNIISRKEFW